MEDVPIARGLYGVNKGQEDGETKCRRDNKGIKEELKVSGTFSTRFFLLRHPGGVYNGGHAEATTDRP